MRPIMRIHLLSALAAVVLMISANGTALTSEIVVIVSAKSQVISLSASQVADIFLGKVSRFPDGNQAIAIDQSEESTARELFYSQFTGKSAAQVRSHWSKIIFTGRGQPPRQVLNSSEAKRLVVENPNAIAYIESRLVDASVRIVPAK